MKFIAASIGGLALSLLGSAPFARSAPSENDPDLVFSRSYIALTKGADFTTITPTVLNPGFNPIIGQQQFQAGGIFDPADIVIDARPDGADPSEIAQTGQLFAGGAQPRFVPEADPGYFLDGECTASGGTRNSKIQSHSCILNLCLGGGGFNCLALYCGTAFKFNPLSTTPSQTQNNAPKLPPSYPCTIFGGTNSFLGAKGTVDISTLTGRTSPRATGEQSGVITQLLNVISNKPLPPAP